MHLDTLARIEAELESDFVYRIFMHTEMPYVFLSASTDRI